MGSQHSTVGRTKSLDAPLSSSADDNQPPGPSKSLVYYTDDTVLRSKKEDSLDGRANTTQNRIQRDQRSKSTLVIVNRSSPPSVPQLEDDPLFKRLQELPAFLPLMYEVENGSNIWGSKGKALAEIRGKLDPISFIHIVRLYEDKLKRHAQSISVEQGRLSKNIKEVDLSTSMLFRTLTERQKKFAKHAEKLGKMNDIAHTLSKCQMTLYDCKETIQVLNDMLPLEERLEPFIWSDETS